MEFKKEESLYDEVSIDTSNGYSGAKQKKPLWKIKKKNPGHFWIVVLLLVIGVLVLVIIGLSVALPIVWTRCDVTETKYNKSTPCEYDWIWHRGKCYFFSTEYNTWTHSQRFCKSHDASLALIDNQEELNFLLRHKGKENYWIGLRRTKDNKAWIWTNGTLYDESLFKVKRSSKEDIEYAYLNTGDVKSQVEFTRVNWICANM